MLITFEGIDGAGKTTTAGLLFQQLKPYYPDLRYFTKKSADFPDSYLQQQMTKFSEVVWPSDLDDQPRDPLGNEFWSLANAAWFAAVNTNRLEPAARDGTPIITDSWYYRLVIKMSLEGLNPNWLYSLFNGVRRPTMVVLLDIHPELAWQRTKPKRETLKPFETGAWQLYHGDEFTRFCQWQGQIRIKLLDLAREKGWFVVEQGNNLPAEFIAGIIAGQIMRIAQIQ